MFVCPANPGHFHFDQNAAGGRLWQRVFSYFVMTRFYECCCEYACGRHIHRVDSSPILLFAKANRAFIPEGACGDRSSVPVSGASCYFLPRVFDSRLEVQLQGKLANASRKSCSNQAKGCRPENSARRQELSMIEQIKEFTAELEIKPFSDSSVLDQGEVPIVYSGPVEKTPSGIAFEAHCGRRKR